MENVSEYDAWKDPWRKICQKKRFSLGLLADLTGSIMNENEATLKKEPSVRLKFKILSMTDIVVAHLKSANFLCKHGKVILFV